jgi:hypothetical protein
VDQPGLKLSDGPTATPRLHSSNHSLPSRHESAPNRPRIVGIVGPAATHLDSLDRNSYLHSRLAVSMHALRGTIGGR